MYTENLVVESVTDSKDWYSISTEDGTGFGLEKKYGVKPKKGDKITLHTYGGSGIRGMDINGEKIYYKSDAQLEDERQEWLAENERKKQAAFKKNKPQMDKDYESLPQVFRERIDRFRENNDRFRIDYEVYEVFCCKQAVEIAEGCKTRENIEEFKKLDFKEQKKSVPNLDDGHSGNTFGCACALAVLYLESPEYVSKMHGSLSPLVGSKEFGDVKK